MRRIDAETMRKWRHYAAHSKKFRTRKKYRRKIREYINQAWHWYAKPIYDIRVAEAQFGGWWARHVIEEGRDKQWE